jgi:hypothetical protein
MKIEVDIFRIAEKTPEQDEYVMVKEQGIEYWKPQVFNKMCNCWDTADGADYERGLRDNDIWMRLPKNIDVEFANKIK